MTVQVSSVEASSRLRDLIDAALRGENVFIIDQGQKTVQLVPVRSAKTIRQFGSAQGLVKMADDFDTPLT